VVASSLCRILGRIGNGSRRYVMWEFHVRIWSIMGGQGIDSILGTRRSARRGKQNNRRMSSKGVNVIVYSGP